MARLRIETAPEITVYDEAFVIKAAAGATAPLLQLKNSDGDVVGNITAGGTLNVVSVSASNAGTGSSALVTRDYVDTLFAGLNWHDPVSAATTEALPTCTYNNGTSGVGATLTASANGALSVDGGAPAVGVSILVKNQAAATQNGIYVVTATGGASAVWVLTRRSDSDNSPVGEVQKGDATFVVGGSLNINCGFILSGTPSGANDNIVFGTDNLVYSQFTGTGAFTAGNGLTVTDNAVNIVTAGSERIVVNADNIDLAPVTVTSNSGTDTTTFIKNVTVDSYGRVTAKETGSVSFTGYLTTSDATSTYAPIASPALSGSPTATTANVADNSTRIATTNYADRSADAAALVVNTYVANTYLTTATASSTYLTQATATSDYLAKADASNTYIAKATVDAKGDLIVASADNTIGRLAVGTDGNFLRANSSATSGLEWGSIPTINDIDDVGGVTITSVASGQFLKYNGSAWVNSSLTETLGITDLSDVTISTAAVNQVLSYNGSAWVNTSNPTVAGDLTVTGNLTVTGTNTVINTAQLHVSDNVIVLNHDEAGTPSQNAGVEIERGTSTNVTLRWNETTDCWEFTNDGTNYQRIITDTVTNAQTASYTLALADSGKMIEMGVATGNTLTIPPNSSVAFPVGTTLTVLQTGAGQCTLTAGAGVTLNGTPGLKLRTTWSSATLIKRATDTWVALGDLVA